MRPSIHWSERDRTAQHRASMRLDAAVLAEMKAEAKRQDRSVSYIAQMALRMALGELRRTCPAAPHRRDV